MKADEGTIGCKLIAYEVYKIDPTTNEETEVKTVMQDVKEYATYCLTNFIFSEGGTYKVQIVCDDDMYPERMAEGKVTINW